MPEYPKMALNRQLFVKFITSVISSQNRQSNSRNLALKKYKVWYLEFKYINSFLAHFLNFL